MTIEQITKFLNGYFGCSVRVTDARECYDLHVDAFPTFEASFGKVTTFRSLAAVAPMLRDGFEEWQREYEAYMRVKTQKRGPYRRRRRR